MSCKAPTLNNNNNNLILPLICFGIVEFMFINLTFPLKYFNVNVDVNVKCVCQGY